MEHAPINFPGLLAILTPTRAQDWVEKAGAVSGSGMDYWYRNVLNEALAHLNVGQKVLPVSITYRSGRSQECTFEGELRLLSTYVIQQGFPPP